MLMTYILNYYFLGAFIIVLFSFLASYKLFPILIHLSSVKKLSKIPEERSSHLYNTPTMGGVGIFFGFTLTFAFLGSILNKYLQIDTSRKIIYNEFAP